MEDDIVNPMPMDLIKLECTTASGLQYYPHLSIIKYSKEKFRLQCCQDITCQFNKLPQHVHCQLCCSKSFQPSTLKKVRDHLEVKHFPYAVQFDDLLVFKCFQPTCCRKNGHYHCPLCPTSSSIIQKSCFIYHLKSHARKDKFDQKVISEDDGLPDEIDIIELDNDLADSMQLESTTASGLKYYQHFSAIKRSKEKFTLKYCQDNSCPFDEVPEHVHCPLCATDSFQPSTLKKVRDHLEVKHFPHAVQFDDLLVLKHFQNSFWKDGRYQCPLCARLSSKKSIFIHHLQWHARKDKFDENLIKALNCVLPDEMLEIEDDVVKSMQLQFTTASGLKYYQHFSAIKRNKEKFTLKYCQDNSCPFDEFPEHVHCPLCATDSFQPSTLKKVRDHLEVKHFPHAVQFDDLLVLKFFQNSVWKDGRYQCPLCARLSSKKAIFIHHLQWHARKDKFDESLIRAVDGMLPDELLGMEDEIVESSQLQCTTTSGLQYYPHFSIINHNKEKITLQHCDDKTCQVDKFHQHVHCPFCCSESFKPNRLKKVRDHLEVKHFSHAVQLDDLLVLKCFQKSCRKDGHYHCPLCSSLILKRTSFTYHLRSHARKDKFDEKLILAADCALPDEITILDNVIHKCEKAECSSNSKKHFHCPDCGDSFTIRHRLVWHVWRCMIDGHQKGRSFYDPGAENLTMLPHPMDWFQEKFHASFVRAVSDIPVSKDESPKGAKYKCVLCPTSKFKPASKQNVSSHYLQHWNKRIEFQGFSILPCNLECNQVAGDAYMHFHCPKCCSIKTSSTEFVDHLSHCDGKSFQDSNCIEKKELILNNNGNLAYSSNIRLAENENFGLGKNDLVSSNTVDFVDISAEKLDDIMSKLETMELFEEIRVPLLHKITSQLPDHVILDILAEISRKTGAGLEMSPGNQHSTFFVVGSPATILHVETLLRSALLKHFNKQETGKKMVCSKCGQSTCVDKEGQKQPKKKKQKPSNSVKCEQDNQQNLEPISALPEESAVFEDAQVKEEEASGTKRKSQDVTTSSSHHNTRKKHVDFSLLAGEVKRPRKDKTDKPKKVSNKPKPKSKPVSTQNASTNTNDGECDTTETPVEQQVEVVPEDMKSGVVPEDMKSGVILEDMKSGVAPEDMKLGLNKAVVPLVELQENNSGSRFQGAEEVVFGDLGDSWQCYACDEVITFVSESSLLDHLSSKHNTLLPCRCFKCDEELQTLKQFVDHDHIKERIQVNEKRKCKLCGYVASNVISYVKHREQSHMGKSWTCNICDKEFGSRAHLLIHKQAVHIKNKTAKCDICGKTFAHTVYLKSHMLRHSREKKDTCGICDKKFYDKKTLENHLETHKPPEDRKYRFLCSFCGKKFLHRAHYKEHLNKHTGAKPFSCNFCGKEFSFRSSVEKHKLHIHSQQMQFPCEICTKQFKSKRQLAQHMVSHTGKSDHTCPKCSKPFSCKVSLKGHLPKCKGVFINTNKFMSSSILVKDSPSVRPSFVPSKPVVESNQSVPWNRSLMIQQDPAITGIQNIISNAAPLNQNNTLSAQNMMDVPLSGGSIDIPVPTDREDLTMYACSECDKVFDTFEAAEQHVLHGHTEPSLTDNHVSSMDTGTNIAGFEGINLEIQ